MPRFATPVACLMLGALACGTAPNQARAESLLEFSAETQMQLDFHVPDAALAAMLVMAAAAASASTRAATTHWSTLSLRRRA